MRTAFLCTLLVLIVTACAFAQDVVSVGKGSYASKPPASAGGAVNAENMKLHVLNQGDRPIPTNNWDTDLYVNGHSRGAELWAYPMMAKMTNTGTSLFAGTKWNGGGNDMVRANPVQLLGVNPSDTLAKEWGDWSLTYRVKESDAKYYDATIARGIPFAWVEYTGVTPIIKTGGATTFFDKTGDLAAMPTKGDTIGLKYGGNLWAIYAPDDTTFANTGGAAGANITVTFAGEKKFLVVALLTDVKDLDTYHTYAFAIVRDTVLSWKYDQKAGEVKQTWAVKTECLKGTEKQTIQGWIPHHYRTTKISAPFLGPEYMTARGIMKTTVGTSFDLTYNFVGFLPMDPAASAPAADAPAQKYPYDPARMATYLKNYSTRTNYGNDTYWGGKDLLQWGQYLDIAAQTGDPTLPLHQANLKKAMIDWLTYTPGETAHYYMYYPMWKGLTGWSPSYGSELWVDHHFHYGYLTMAAAYLGLRDKEWLKDYGPMARLVAKEYANWDHNDKMFPFLRCFDVWEGHSQAGGTSSPTGNNQESSSEAMQSWGGLFLLGAAMGDDDMMAAGASGWVSESQASLEYWFDQYGGNFQPGYTKPMAGMVWSAGLVYGNYFTGDMMWTYAIQLMPNSPALQYFEQDPSATRKQWDLMFNLTRSAKADSAVIDAMGTGLGNVMITHATHFDPDFACQVLDELWTKGSNTVKQTDTPGLSYFTAHAKRALGRVQFNFHTSLPLSSVYYNTSTKAYTYAAQNPTDKAITVTVYGDGKAIGTFSAAPNTLTAVHTLDKL